jgi:uncharacterized protein YcbX
MTARLAHIFRHPIKAHGREELASVVLSAGQALPWDRHWAVAHDLSKFDALAPGWMPCINFQRAARTPALMAITARFDEATGQMTLMHPDLPVLTFFPETEGARLIDWVAPISPQLRFRPAALVRAPGRAMTDSAFPSVSIKNLASNAALGATMGRDLSIDRWRGNLWLDGVEPWAEMRWLGRRLRVGGAVLEIREKSGALPGDHGGSRDRPHRRLYAGCADGDPGRTGFRRLRRGGGIRPRRAGRQGGAFAMTMTFTQAPAPEDAAREAGRFAVCRPGRVRERRHRHVGPAARRPDRSLFSPGVRTWGSPA